jgi:hypothetical protein
MSENEKATAIDWALRQPTFPKQEDWVKSNYSIDPPPCGHRKLNALFGSYNNFRREAGVDILHHDYKEEITMHILKRDCIINDEGCWVWQKRLDSAGYANKNIKGKNWLLHRYVHIILGNNAPPSSKHTVDHICRNRACIAPDHLRWATASEQAKNRNKHKQPIPLSRPPKASCLEDRLNWYLQQSEIDENGCMIAPIRPKDRGYIQIEYASKAYSLHILSALQKYTLPITRISYESFTNDNIVLHKCNNRACCNSDHLEIGTGKQGKRQNTIDSRSYHSGVKLKAEDIPEIREIYHDCLEMHWAKTNIYRHIGSIYKVRHDTVSKVILGKSWSDIK